MQRRRLRRVSDEAIPLRVHVGILSTGILAALGSACFSRLFLAPGFSSPYGEWVRERSDRASTL